MNFRQKMARLALIPAAVAATGAHAAGNDPFTAALTSIDLTNVAPAVAALGILIIGIVMAFKGIDLGKRAVKKA